VELRAVWIEKMLYICFLAVRGMTFAISREQPYLYAALNVNYRMNRFSE